MKKYILAIVTTFILVGCLSCFSYAQSSCDEVKKENEYLKKALKMLEPEKSQTVDNTEIRLIKCTGDAKAQTITLEFILINKQANKKVTLREISGIDIEGNQYDTNSEMFKIGKDNYSSIINTDVPVKAGATLKKTLPAVKFLKLFKFEYRAETSRPVDVEFRDIKVDWK
jgi:uncharacterized protein YcfL